MKLNTAEYEKKMKKTIELYQHDLSTIRAGRANPAVLDKVEVDYYGSPTAINAVAEVKVTDARTILIQPWESSMTKTIEKAILASDIGINPQNDGRALRLIFPPLTEERRKELTKQVDKLGEKAKVSIRNVRREANDKCKDMKKKNEMTEDEQKASEKAVQDITDKLIKDVDVITAAKKKEIMEI